MLFVQQLNNDIKKDFWFEGKLNVAGRSKLQLLLFRIGGAS